MKVVVLAAVGIDDAAAEAAAVVRAGGVVVFPAERLYGLAADARSPEAVRRVFSLKGRDPGKPVPVLAADAAMAAEWVVIDPALAALVDRFWPGLLTLVLPVRRPLAPEVSATETLGIRVPGNAFARELARLIGAPITATSANEAGGESGRTTVEALAGLSSAPDLVIDAGELPGPPGSTVARWRDNQIEVLRPGAIAGAELLECITRQG